MPLYMTQVGYTSEAWAALTRNPEDRSEVFGTLAKSMDGRLVRGFPQSPLGPSPVPLAGSTSSLWFGHGCVTATLTRSGGC